MTVRLLTNSTQDLQLLSKKLDARINFSNAHSVYLATSLDIVAVALSSANRCTRCGKKIEIGEVGYFRLNERSDRFDLRCKDCLSYEIGIYGH